MEEKLRCSSCNVDVSNLKGTVMFKCPNCDKTTIVRCDHCKSIGAKYKCQCGFEGPN